MNDLHLHIKDDGFVYSSFLAYPIGAVHDGGAEGSSIELVNYFRHCVPVRPHINGMNRYDAFCKFRRQFINENKSLQSFTSSVINTICDQHPTGLIDIPSQVKRLDMVTVCHHQGVSRLVNLRIGMMTKLLHASQQYRPITVTHADKSITYDFKPTDNNAHDINCFIDWLDTLTTY